MVWLFTNVPSTEQPNPTRFDSTFQIQTVKKICKNKYPFIPNYSKLPGAPVHRVVPVPSNTQVTIRTRVTILQIVQNKRRLCKCAVLEVVYWFTQVLGYSHFVIDRRRQRLFNFHFQLSTFTFQLPGYSITRVPGIFFFHNNPTQPSTSKNQHFCTYMNT